MLGNSSSGFDTGCSLSKFYFSISGEKFIASYKRNVYRKCYRRFQATVSSFDKGKLNIYMLFVGWKVRVVKNCDPGLGNAARGSRAAFPGRPNSANNMFTGLFFFLK